MVAPEFISRTRLATTALLSALDALHNVRRMYDALDLGNTLTPEDFQAGHADITLPQLVAALGSVAALDTLLAQGHATNLYRIAR